MTFESSPHPFGPECAVLVDAAKKINQQRGEKRTRESPVANRHANMAVSVERTEQHM